MSAGLSSSVPTIACINATTKISDAEILHVCNALRVQVTQHFAPLYGKSAAVVAVPKGKAPPKGAWWLVFADNSDEAGALGYHDLTPDDLPLGKVFVETTKKYGGIWSITASHEILEMLADPAINRTACIQDEAMNRLYAWEVCDACEDDQYAYKIGDVPVSDFVTEAWFDPRSKGPFDFKGHVKAPLSLLPGGYISVLDLDKSTGWTQLTASWTGEHPYRIASLSENRYGERAKVGSRRERRRVHPHRWQRSVEMPKAPEAGHAADSDVG